MRIVLTAFGRLRSKLLHRLNNPAALAAGTATHHRLQRLDPERLPAAAQFVCKFDRIPMRDMPTGSAGDLCVISAPCEIHDRIELDSSHEPNWNEQGTIFNMPVIVLRILSIAHRGVSRVSGSLGNAV